MKVTLGHFAMLEALDQILTTQRLTRSLSPLGRGRGERLCCLSRFLYALQRVPAGVGSEHGVKDGQ